ncbi:M28 family peptidase [Gallaecimonas sp. GXIMD4217]|uniref:M28 family metallopeptidase n=1 Tax=Gallaecimonas sp. GXIMD4217 TaxID=3131927 RepID=UPI00311B2FAA
MKKHLSLAALALSWGALAQGPAGAVPGEVLPAGLDAAQYRSHVKTLSSDAFEGRLPATRGETLTLDYLQGQFQALGLKPGFGNGFRQPVPLMAITAAPDMQLKLGDLVLDYKEDMVVHSRHPQKQVELKDSELVFVGYGIHAPELGWDDYAGLDVKGKTVVMLINDPGFATGDARFQGKAMTYYGRWDYKYAEASRQGAAGALIVHQSAPASYGWSVIQSSWTGPQYDLAGNDQPRVKVEGWISLDAAHRLFGQAGLDFDKLSARAAKAPTQADLKARAAVTVRSRVEKTVSHNLMAVLPGQTDETLIVTAHWDHIGKDEGLGGDQIYNGAMDNATGTAGLLSLAASLAPLYQGDDKPRRSIAFLAVTAEEQGLLGSSHYVANPAVPLARTVANINMDSLSVYGPTRDMVVVGKGKTSIEHWLHKAAQAQGRTLVGSSRPEAGGYYRSDHFNFAKAGVPALYAGGGSQPWDETVASYREQMKARLKGCYHGPCDEFQADWDLRGALADLALFHQVLAELAVSEQWPKWQPGAEFKRPSATTAQSAR